MIEVRGRGGGGSVVFDTPGPPSEDGLFTGQLAVGHDPAGQTTELWRWDGAAWDQEIGAPPFFQVSKTAQSTTSTATTSIVDFDTADEDPEGLFSLVDNFATIERPGVYYINAKVTFATSSATGVRLVEVRNGAGVQFGDSRPGVAQTNHKISTGGDLRMAVGDFLWVQVAQTSGSTMNVSSVLSARWVRP